ncbi:prolyl oligopeptidase family serine peptidase [Streptomyces sp. NPDC101062]|uniref:S9 family peptidase n=1 Tax=unclassified Streptomyces TaxID=2593676 RepID=UPI003819FF10
MTSRETISVEEFFGPPPRAKTTLSPDGTNMAYLAPWKNRMNVWIESVDAPGDARCVTTEDRGVVGYHWTHDPRWLLYSRDQGGDENLPSTASTWRTRTPPRSTSRPLAESDRLVEALRARDVPVEYIVMEDEGHAIENPENVVALYTAAERFLAEHLRFEAHPA